MDDFAIQVKDLSKSYKLYDDPVDRLKESLHPFRKKYHRDFYALKDVNLDVKKGETIGVIGSNGSGKSTLLKIITGVLTPSSGSVSVNGRISSLLELGAGFNPELTGIENIYFSGTIMGYTKQEIDAKLDDIIAFADIGDFIGQPVKTYSSGMYVRLAFASAVHVDPDILIVDEALAVGDFRFRQKCAEKINELKRRATVLLVSHSMRDVLMLCSRAVVMEKGNIVCQGSPEEAVNRYLALVEASEEAKKEEKRVDTKSRTPSPKLYGDFCHSLHKITDVSAQWIDGAGDPALLIDHGSSLVLAFSFRLLIRPSNLIIGIPIWNSKGFLVTAINSDADKVRISLGKDGIVRGSVRVGYVVLNPDEYVAAFVVHDGKEPLYRQLMGRFTVRQMPIHYGAVTQKSEWRIENRSYNLELL